MLLAIRAEALVARAATSSSTCFTTASRKGSRCSNALASSRSLGRSRRSYASSAAAAAARNRSAQDDVSKGFYRDSSHTTKPSAQSFAADTFDDFGHFGSFSATSSKTDWLHAPPANVFGNPSPIPIGNDADYTDQNDFHDRGFDQFLTTGIYEAQPSAFNDFLYTQQPQPSHSTSTISSYTLSTPTFVHLQNSTHVPSPSPPRVPSTLGDFSSLAVPKPKPRAFLNTDTSNSSSSSTLSRPPVSTFRDPLEKLPYTPNPKFNKRVSGENSSEIRQARPLDLSRFSDLERSLKSRRPRSDYSTLPRVNDLSSRLGSSTNSSRLEPEFQKKIREERKLQRQQAEKAALEDALKANGVSASTLFGVEKAAADEAAAKKKAERMAEKVERRKVAMTVKLPVATTVRGLSQLLSKKTEEVVAALAEIGYEKLRKPTHIVRQKIASALADHYSIPFELEARAVEDVYPRNELSDKAKIRSPLVCVMGHVDHGKTTLIDCIRKTRLAAQEHGGITQKIGAFAVTAPNGSELTIFDTPGHEAFSMMRARGASLVDVVILVVAADDGVMPQTVESIRMVRAANVPFVVAITKCDLREAKPDLVRQQLMEHGIYSEGDTGSEGIIIEEMSGKTGEGVEDFLSLVHMRGELEEPLADFEGPAEAVVIESAVDKRNGILANVLVRNGELKVGDSFVLGSEYGKVKQLRDQNNKPVQSALPSMPVSIVGTRELPNIGDCLLVVENEKKARQVSEYRKAKLSRKNTKQQALWESEDMFAEKAECKEFYSLLKADCKGSIEAVESFFSSLQAPNDEVSMSVVKSSIGAVTEGDVALAQSTGAMIHAFNVKVTPAAKKLAKQNGVQIRENNVIFHLMDDVTDFLSENLADVFESKPVGRALVKKTFHSGKLAGCIVSEGSLLSRKGTGFRVIRNDETVFEQEHAPFQSLQRFDKVVEEITQGVECGVDLGGFVVEVGDVIECVERVKQERKVTTNIAEVCQTQWKSLFESNSTSHTRTQSAEAGAGQSNAENEVEAEATTPSSSSAAESENETEELSMEDREALKKVGQEIAKSEARRRLSDILDKSSAKHY